MWKWIKIPKAIALLAFVLPWATVSCQKQPLARASGLDIIMGKLTPVTSAMADKGPGAESMGTNWLLLIAAVVILAGLAATFLPKRTGGLIVLVTSVAGLVLTWLGTSQFTQTILSKAVEDQRGGSNNPFGGGSGEPNMAALIQVEWGVGFWLTMLGLIAAAVMAWMAFSGREAALSGLAAGTGSGGAASAEDAESAWHAIPDKGDPNALRRYLARYPDGPHADTARATLAARDAPPPVA